MKDRCLREALQGLRDREVRQGHETYIREGYDYRTAEDGRAEGFAEGEAKGRSEGLAEGKVLIAKAMIAKGMDRNTISEITGLSDEELESL